MALEKRSPDGHDGRPTGRSGRGPQSRVHLWETLAECQADAIVVVTSDSGNATAPASRPAAAVGGRA
jgi:hypothetical protein